MITFRPDVGDVLMCDFAGNRAPEIVKRRPVVVVASRRDSAHVVSVVPLSSRQPSPVEAWHASIVTVEYEFMPDDVPVMWGKGDLLTHVAYERLDRMRIRGVFSRCRLTDTDYERVRRAAAAALGFEAPELAVVRAA